MDRTWSKSMNLGGIFEEVLDGYGFVLLVASRYDLSLLPSYLGARITMKITQILT
jgi:hypothetical protein